MIADGFEARSFNAALLFEPHTVQNKSGGPFQVFTPFWRHCSEREIDEPAKLRAGELPAPLRWMWLSFNMNLTHHRKPWLPWQELYAHSDRRETQPLWYRWLMVALPPERYPADEGALKPLIDRVVERFPSVSVGSYPRWQDPAYSVRVTFDGRDEASVSAAAKDFSASLPPEWLVREE